MNIINLVNQLELKGIYLSLAGSKEEPELKLNGARSALTPELVAQLKSAKKDIIDYLKLQQLIVDEWQVSNQLEAPLLAVQRGIWFASQQQGGQSLYNIPSEFELVGQLDVERVKWVLEQLQSEHQALRCSISDSGETVLIEDGTCVLPFYFNDFSSVDSKALADSAVSAHKNWQFDLSTAPLWRCQLVRLGTEHFKLLLNFHHTIADGWSLGLFINAFVKLYNVDSETESHSQDKGLLVDALNWRNQYDIHKKDTYLPFWQSRLSDVEPINSPYQGIRPQHQQFASAHVKRELAPELTSTLQHLANQWGVGLFDIMQTSFAVILKWFSNKQSVLFGMPSAGRNRLELESIFGCFVDTVPVYRQFPSGHSFAQLVQSFAEQNRIELESAIGMNALVQALEIELNPAYAPLIQVMFSYQNNANRAIKLGNCEMRDITVEHPFSHFDIMATVLASDDLLCLDLGYATSLFDPELMSFIVAQWESLLTNVIREPNLSLDTWLISDVQQSRLLKHFNVTECLPTLNESIVTLFNQQVEIRPNDIALIGERTLTYCELDDLTTQIAKKLPISSPETVIAIAMERSVEWIVSALAILKAGGVYLPLSEQEQSSRRSDIVLNSGCQLVLCKDLESVENLKGLAHCITFEDLLGCPDCRDTLPDISYEQLAYIVYTSGSTGVPKGVTVAHRGVTRLVKEQSYADFASQRVWLQCSDLSFDAATLEIWAPLLNGGRCVLANSVQGLSTNELKKMVLEHQVDSLFLSTSWFNAMVDTDVACFKGVKQVLFGGDKHSVEHVNKVLESNPELTLIHAYGPTENTTFSCCYHISERLAAYPIGTSLTRSTALILDEKMNLCPIGIAGELYLGGAGLARNYFNLPALTASQFVPDPFSAVPGARLYRSGDKAVLLPNGMIEYVDRMDNQIKIRGFRVELGEITAVLNKAPKVKEAKVAFDKASQRIFAYALGDHLDSEALSVFLASKLPTYMCPSHITTVSQWPYNKNGKIDLKQLQQSYVEVLPNIGESSTYYTDSEQVIAEIWQQHLQLADLPPKDSNFFAIGGHSLLAVRVSNAISKRLNVACTLEKLLFNPTVAGLAKTLKRIERAPVPLVDLKQTTFEPSENQRALLFSSRQRLVKENHVYFAIEVKGELDISALNSAWYRIVKENQALRLGFMLETGNERITLSDDIYRAIAVIPLRSDSDKVAQFQSFVEAPFDFEEPGLWRLGLFIEANTQTLVFAFHHLIFDGGSMSYLFDKLSEYYQANCQGLNLPNIERKVDFLDLISFELSQPTHDEFWQQQLSQQAKLALPYDCIKRSSVRHNQARTHITHVNSSILAPLSKLSRDQKTSLFCTLASAFQVLISTWAGQSHFALTTTVAGREQEEYWNTIGYFANLLAIPCQVDKSTTFSELVTATSAVWRQCLAHQSPYSRVVQHFPEGAEQAFQVAFVLQSTLKDSDSKINNLFGELDANLVDVVDDTIAYFDIGLHVKELSNGLELHWVYAADCFAHASIVQLANRFEQLLASLGELQQAPLIQTVQLTENEIAEQLAFNLPVPHVDAAFNDGIAARFGDIAKRTPFAPAVHDQDGCWTYEQLNVQASNLAQQLVEAGVEVGSSVAICLPRGKHWVLAMLAIVKAGACYVPIDMQAPEARMEHMLADANVALLITDSQAMEVLPAFSIQFIPVLLLDELELYDASDLRDFFIPVHPSQPAYIIYTSGSTGLPKGVVVNHRAITELVNEPYYVNHNEHLHTLQAGVPSFDAITFEVWAPLLHGGQVSVIDKMTLLDFAKLESYVVNQGVNTVFFTTAIFNRIVAQHPTLIGHFDLVMIGGERVNEHSVSQCLEVIKGKSVRLQHVYGPTETTTFSCWHDIGEEFGTIPIGRGLAGNALYVLNSALEMLPLGAIGELYISGQSLAQGYLNNPGLTAERFVPNPFFNPHTDESYSRLYRTGDLVRWNGKGELEYIGRLDHQIKIRGHRIELGEIEFQLCKHDEITHAYVRPLIDEEQTRLVAYYVGHPQDAHSLRLHLEGKIPGYMVPHGYLHVAQLPLNANGKVDINALPPVTEIDWLTQGQYRAPQTKEALCLASVWQKVLAVPTVGLDDNFFALGGDSLSAIKLRAELQAKGYDFELSELFEHPSLERLSACLSPFGQAAQAISMIPFSLVSDTDKAKLSEKYQDAYPLSYLQKGMLFHSEFEAKSSLYHDIVSYCVPMAYDANQMRESINELVARHAILRTCFVFNGTEQALQCVLPAFSPEIKYLDWRNRDKEDVNAALQAWIEDEKYCTFAEQQPYYRVFVHHLDDHHFQYTLSFHHALLDGWSESLLATQWLELYDGLQQQQTVKFDSPSLGFSDFIALELESVNSEVDKQFWANYLHDVVPTSLRSMTKASSDSQEQSYLTVSLPTGLKALTHLNISAKAISLAVHIKALLLLSGQSDVVTGIVHNGRPEVSGGDEICGMFLNTLPVRAQSRGGSWKEWLLYCAKLEREQLKFRRYPLPQLLDDCNQSTLFDCLFNFTHFQAYEQSGELALAMLSSRTGVAEASDSLSVDFQIQATGELTCFISYHCAYYEKQTIEQLGLCIEVVANAMLDDLNAQHEQLLLPVNVSRLTSRSMIPTSLEHGGFSVIEQIRQQTQAHPDACAIEEGDVALSFAQMDQLTDRMALNIRSHVLQMRDHQQAVAVGVLLEPSLSLWLSALAILKAGHIYSPLDPKQPKARLAQLTQHCAMVITSEASFDLCGHATRVEVGDLQVEPTLLEALPLVPHPQQAAYQIFTSGTTGEPKGVLIGHQALANHVNAVKETFQLTCHDRVAQFSSPIFDVSLEEVLPTWCAGATVVLHPRSVKAPIELTKWLENHRITIFNPPTAYWQMWLKHLTEDSQLADLRLVVVGGEAIDAKAADNWASRFPNVQWMAGYGPTETTITSSFWTYQHRLLLDRVPLGQPVPNAGYRVLNSRMFDVPRGVVGELYIEGQGLALGYAGDPVKTACAFLPAENGQRLYRSGDRVFVTDNDEIYFEGRMDNQVKVRGYRIELLEVESKLLACPHVMQAAVKYLPELGVLAAYYVTEESVDIAAIKAFLQSELPAYAIPDHFIQLDAMPLTLSGKIDRKALREPTLSHDTYVAPVTELESTLLAIWQQVFQNNMLHMNVDFFALGGNSLKALDIISRTAQVVNTKVPLKYLYETPNLKALAERLSHISTQNEDSTVLDWQHAWLPLTPSQSRMWSVHKLQGQSPQYNMTQCLKVRATKTHAQWTQLGRLLVQKHPALQTVISEQDGLPRQVFKLHELTCDFQHLDEQDVDAYLSKAAACTFEIEDSELVRLHVVETQRVSYVLLVVHHIISDGHSMELLTQDIIDFIEKEDLVFADDGRIRLAQYRHYVLSQINKPKELHYQQQVDYWRGVLHDLPTLSQLPFSSSIVPVESNEGGVLTHSLSHETVKALNLLSKQLGVTRNSIMLALWQLLLHTSTAQQKVCTGIPVSHRDTLSQNLVGYAINTLPVVSELQAGQSVQQYIEATATQLTAVLSNQDVPLDALVDLADVPRDLSFNPLFQSVFSWHDLVEKPLHSQGKVELYTLSDYAAQFDFVLNVSAFSEAVELIAHFKVDRYRTTIAKYWLTNFGQLVERAIASLSLPVTQLQECRESQLAKAKESEAMILGQASILTAFAKQVQDNPTRVAIISQQDHAIASLTYAELDVRSGQLATWLREQGVQSGDIVGLDTIANIERAVLMLAVLKVGAAYLPVDVDMPDERLQQMLAQSNCQYVLARDAITFSKRVQVTVLTLEGVDCNEFTVFVPKNHHPKTLAYVNFTSGSTGMPKAVAVSHAGVVALVNDREGFHWDTNTVMLNMASFNFDATVLEIWGTLLSGGCLAMPGAPLQSLPQLEQWLNTFNVNSVFVTTSLFSALVDEGTAWLAQLSHIGVGGDKLSPSHAKRALEAHPNLKLYNLYGPTEVTVACSALEITLDVLAQTVPLGGPMTNADLYILNERLKPVELGAVGELYVATSGLAWGYLGQSAFTAERFLPNPFGLLGSRLYATGDLVRLRPDGLLEFVGRKDEQIKLRGYRIELGEVEQTLLRFKGVTSAEVLIKAGSSEHQKSLVAAIISEQPICLEDLNAFLQTALPTFMVPSQLIQIDKIPLTMNGKLDRKSLLAQFSVESASADVAYRSSKESQLAAIWRDLLNVENIDRHANFFSLGGDSIMAIQLASKMAKLGFTITPKQVFEAKTLSLMAEKLSVIEVSERVQYVDELAGDVRLLPVQKWFLEHNPEIHFNQAVLLNAPKSSTDWAVLQDSLELVVSWHDAFRLRFSFDDSQGVWQQYYLDADQEAGITLEYLSISDADYPSALDQAHLGFSFVAGPLAKAVYYPNQGTLQLVVHHLIVDAVSWQPLVDDLQEIYLALVQQETPMRPNSTASVRQWSNTLWQQYENTHDGIEYWQTQLPKRQATSQLIQTEVSHQWVSEAISVPATITSQLVSEIQTGTKSEFSELLLSALSCALHDLGFVEETIMLEGHGRQETLLDLALNRTVGWFTSLFPLKLNCKSSLVEAIKELKLHRVGRPDEGLSFMPLWYLNRAQFADFQLPNISFNYLGRFGHAQTEGLFSLLTESSGQSLPSQYNSPFEMELNSLIDASGALHMEIRARASSAYAKHLGALIERIGVHLNTLSNWSVEIQSQAVTRSNFTLCPLAEEEFELAKSTLRAKNVGIEQIEQVLPLTPLQHGMLHHSQAAQAGSVYAVQVVHKLTGKLNVDWLKDAWQALIESHTALRACFIQNAQFILRDVEPVWQHISIVDKPLAQHAELIDSIVAEALIEPFDFEIAPLMRLTLIACSSTEQYLIWTHHHAIADGWSMPILTEQWLSHYHHLEQGKGEVIRAVGSDFGVYCHWLSRQSKDQAMDFWRALLSDVQSPSLLCPSQNTPAEAHQIERIVEQLNENIMAQCQRQIRAGGYTLNAAVQAMWGATVSHFSGNNIGVFGSIVAGRPSDLEGAQNMVGSCINTCPVKVSVTSDCTLEQLVAQVQEQQLQRSSFEFIGLADVKNVTAVPSDQELFDTLVVFENYPSAEDEHTGGLQISESYSVEQPHYPITLIVLPSKELTLELSYDALKIAPETVALIGRYLKGLLTAFASEPNRNVVDVQSEVIRDLLPESSVQDVMALYHQELGYEGIVTAFQRQVQHNPSSLALVGEQGSVDYATLDLKTNWVASCLFEAGATSGVAIHLPRSFEWVYAAIGVLKVGGFYVPVDSKDSIERIADLLLQNNINEVICTAKDSNTFAQCGIKPLVIDFVAARTCAPIIPCEHFSQLAYMTFTSGTTGVAKGVAVTHQGVLRLVQNQRYLDFGPQHNWLLASNLSFDAATLELWAPLINGGTCVVGPIDVFSGAEFAKFVEQYNVSSAWLTASLFSTLVEIDVNCLSGLSQLAVGGDRVSPNHARVVREQFPQLRLINGYGPTENTTFSCCYPIEEVDEDGISIGQAIRYSTAVVLDDLLRPCPPDVTGTLYVGGAGLAQGYWQAPVNTALSFVPDVTGSSMGGRLYNTGDRVTCRSSHDLMFNGRQDNQIKVRGYRVELQAIASVIAQHPSVKDAKVIAEEIAGQIQLCAFVLSDTSKQAEIRAFCKGKLPHFMMVDRLFILATWPLTRNGKVDLVQCRALIYDEVNKYESAIHAPEMLDPDCEFEIQVSQWVAKVLGRPELQCSMLDSFFALGGNSLQAMQLVATAKSKLGVELPLKQIYQQPKLFDICSNLLSLKARTLNSEEELETLMGSLNDSRMDELLSHLEMT